MIRRAHGERVAAGVEIRVRRLVARARVGPGLVEAVELVLEAVPLRRGVVERGELEAHDAIGLRHVHRAEHRGHACRSRSPTVTFVNTTGAG